MNLVIPVVDNCPRCGESHTNLFFKEMVKPAGEYTHWAICPTTGDPILSSQNNPFIVAAKQQQPTKQPSEESKEALHHDINMMILEKYAKCGKFPEKYDEDTKTPI